MPPGRLSDWLLKLSGVSITTKDALRNLVAAADSGEAFEPPVVEAPGDSAEMQTFAPQLSDGQVLLDRFRIVRFLGRGGMGEVYAASDLLTRQDVAVKIVTGMLAGRPEAFSQIRREIQIARRIRHPNVCHVFDIHLEKNGGGSEIVFLSMDLLAGRTLQERIQQDGPLTPAEARLVMSDVAAGLDAIHAAGIVHRDLKCGNIMLVNADENGGPVRSVILDFGLARDRNVIESLSMFGSKAIVGTPAFMAPEQLRSEGAGPAADIYALGVVIYEALSGRLPFEGDTAIAIALRKLQQAPPPLSGAAPQAGKDWGRAVACCLQAEADYRPKSGAEVMSIVGGQASGSLYATRRRILVGAAGTSAAVGAGGYWAWTRPHVAPAQAQMHFLQAEEFAKRRNKESIDNAISSYRKALGLDPDYAEAWAGLADSYATAVNFAFLEPKYARTQAATAVERALALDASLAKAIVVKAYLLSVDFQRWKEADAEFRRALRYLASDARLHSSYASYLGRSGRADEAVLHARRAVALDPASITTNQQLATEFFRAGRFPEFLTQAREVVRLQPFESFGHLALARALEWNNQLVEAERELDMARLYGRGEHSAPYRATLLVAQGRLQEAVVLAARIRSGEEGGKVEANSLAGVYGALKDPATVAEILELGLGNGDTTVLAVFTNPYVRASRSHPEMAAVFRRLGF